jgi:two-component system nitrogen regulation sensor histidine kinase NtrY
MAAGAACAFYVCCRTATALIVVGDGKFLYTVITVPLVVYSVLDLIRFNKKAQDEVNQFVESIHYRDFSRHFDVRKAPNELKAFA